MPCETLPQRRNRALQRKLVLDWPLRFAAITQGADAFAASALPGFVACFLATAGLLFLQTPRTPRPVQNAAQNAIQAHVEPAQTPVQAPEAIQTASIPAEKPRAVRKLSRPKVTTSTVAYSREFVALPGYDPEVPAADLHIVRVQLPTSTLWQMGAPINPTGLDRRVLADFVVSQDGTPYGVRLVHTTIF